MLVTYEINEVSTYYTYDIFANLLRAAYHTFAAAAYCSDLWPAFFGGSATFTQVIDTIQTVLDFTSYGLLVIQLGQSLLSVLAGDALLFGLYTGEISGTFGKIIAEALGLEFML